MAYIENMDLFQLITEYKTYDRKRDYEKLGKCFILMCTRIMTRPCFSRYSKDRQDDMMSNALFNMVKAVPNFRLDYKKNPFSFFTRIATNAYIQRINFFNKQDKLYKSISYMEQIEEGEAI